MYASQKSAAALAAGKPLVDATGKELKPTLSSGPVRTRKRNIQTKRDPEAFRNRLLEVFDEAVRLCADHRLFYSALASSLWLLLPLARSCAFFSERVWPPCGRRPRADMTMLLLPWLSWFLSIRGGCSVCIAWFGLQEGDVKKLVQLLDNDSLDYSRYGDVFGEVILAGNIVEPGGSLRSAPTPHCVFESETEENATIGVEAMHQIMRRKPFLRARFDAVVSKLLICLSTFGDVERDRFAFAVGLMLSRNMVRRQPRFRIACLRVVAARVLGGGFACTRTCVPRPTASVHTDWRCPSLCRVPCVVCL